MTAATLLGDAGLLSSLRAGDADAYEYFVREYAARLLAGGRRCLRIEEDAADAVQEAFFAAFKAIDRFEANSSLGTWLHRIVVNACLMKRRSQARRKTSSIDDFLPRFDETGHHAQLVCPWSQ